jgi:acetylornithine deacetylase/succinyl-diaminopimelate desuccinylase-like protein
MRRAARSHLARKRTGNRGRSGRAVLVAIVAAVLVNAAVLMIGQAMADTPVPNATASARKAPAPAQAAAGSRTSRPKPIDWDKITQEATDLLSKYIKINTSNPPGNEIAAARMLKDKFLSDGIPANIWEPLPGRGIVAARLHGIGKHNKALILLSHMDVVPANPKEWEVPPFSGEVKDGKIWGRGAIDDKGPGVLELMAMLAIKRAGILLDRDILFVATADEEEGGKNGAGWFVDHEASVFSDAGFLLNEGGSIRVQKNGKMLYAVSVTEKTPLWLRISAEGPAGHASDPPSETAVTELVRALQKVIEYRAPVRIIGPVQESFHAQAVIDGGPKQLLDLQSSLKDPAYLKQFLAVPEQNALVRDTLTPTVLSASEKTNVISASAYAELDGRLLPGTDPKGFVKEIRKVIGDDSIKVDVILNFAPVSSPQRSELMTAIETLARTRDNSQVVPTLLGGFTDSHYFRQKKIIAYGFIPIEVAQGQPLGIHGVNEKIGVKDLGDGIQRMVQLLEIFGGRK